MNFTSKINRAPLPSTPHSAISRAACLGSASHSTLFSHHLISRFKERPSSASSKPGPMRGEIVILHCLATSASNHSRAVLEPVDVKSSPPWTDVHTSFLGCHNMFRCDSLCRNPKPIKVQEYSFCNPSAARHVCHTCGARVAHKRLCDLDPRAGGPRTQAGRLGPASRLRSGEDPSQIGCIVKPKSGWASFAPPGADHPPAARSRMRESNNKSKASIRLGIKSSLTQYANLCCCWDALISGSLAAR